MKEQLKQLELFFKSSRLDRGLRLAVAIIVPFAVLYFLGHFKYAPAVVVGAFLNAPGDIPGSIKRKINAILIIIVITMIVTAIILVTKPFLPLLLFAIALISFSISLISVYGFRGSLVSFSGLLAMVLAFAIQKESLYDILVHVSLMGVGGLWYLVVSFIFEKLAPEKDQNQLLSDTLLLTGEYLQLRGQLLTNKTERKELQKQSFALQNQINEKHETLRESLFADRRRSGRSRFEEKQLLIFICSVNIFELIEAKHLDYNTVDSIFGHQEHFLRPSNDLNTIMANHLIRLSELLIQKDKIPKKDELLEALSKANDAIRTYIDTIKLPDARNGALILKNLYDYQEQLLQEVRAIRRVMANVKDASKVSLRRQDASQFLTLQEYRFDVIFQNFNLNSSIFRHALRFSIAIVFAYLLGILFDIKNTYWILLTIVVIMRPSYGLTKDRSKDRIIGTLIGAAIAIGIVFITQNTIVYSVLAIVSLVLAFSLIQQNYKSAAALITISVIFVYCLINPDAFEVIQYRIIDTVIGATIAVIANYTLFPSWEADNIKGDILEALKKNKQYLLNTRDLYLDKHEHRLSYNVARKEAFLAISNLNGAFQRMTQDPQSKQKEFELVYEIVTLNQTMISALASIGNFVISHQTTEPSKEFNLLIDKISNILKKSMDLIGSQPLEITETESTAENAEEKLWDNYTQLSSLRDKNIDQGKNELDTKTLHGLQEAFLIGNQMSWLKSLSESLIKACDRYRLSSLE